MTAQINLHFILLKLQCRRKLEDKRNEWARAEPITQHEACDEEDYDVEYFLPGSRDSDDLCSQEVVISPGRTPSNSDAGETLKNANEEVDNNNSEFTKEKESNQASHKNSNIEENKKSNPTTENDSAVKRKKKSRQVSFKPRKKRICPLKGCKSRVVDLPRHLRDVHKWARDKAQKATSHFRMRESFSSEVVENGKAKSGKIIITIASVLFQAVAQ